MTYDPAVFSVTAADVYLGTVPLSGSGWQVTAEVDPATGQIGIDLYSTTPIDSTLGGSLVTIDFHTLGRAATGTTPINLAASVDPSGTEVFQTELADNQGLLTLHAALTNASGNPEVDGEVTVTAAADVDAAGTAALPPTALPAAPVGSDENVVAAATSEAMLAGTFIDNRAVPAALGGSDVTGATGTVQGDLVRGPAVPPWVPATREPAVSLPVDPGTAATVPAVNRLPSFGELPLAMSTPAPGPSVLGSLSSQRASDVLDETDVAPVLDEPALDDMLDALLSSRLETSRTTRGELEQLIAGSEDASAFGPCRLVRQGS